MKIKNKSMIWLIIIIIVMFFLIKSCSDDSNSKYSVNKQNEMIQATAQIVLKDYGYKISTSSLLEDWDITKMQYNNNYRWTVITYSGTQKIKWIFEWSGEDKDDLILLYLLVNGNEIVNNLNK